MQYITLHFLSFPKYRYIANRKCRSTNTSWYFLTYATNKIQSSQHLRTVDILLPPDKAAKSTLSDKLLSDNQIADNFLRLSKTTLCLIRMKKLLHVLYRCQFLKLNFTSHGVAHFSGCDDGIFNRTFQYL